MPHKDPSNYQRFDWVILSVVALWAGLSTFMQRELKGVKFRRKVYLAVQDLMLSSGTAYLVGIGLMSYGMNEGVSLGLAGYAGHKATRFMILFERYMEKKAGVKIDEK